MIERSGIHRGGNWLVTPSVYLSACNGFDPSGLTRVIDPVEPVAEA